mmetsp:Transcript_26858/g.44510  ORF Transcript_26858/g.44510 Transcript_26858/m.44510 type:complete len:81 (-) Transcript_26858:27-269(-)
MASVCVENRKQAIALRLLHPTIFSPAFPVQELEPPFPQRIGHSPPTWTGAMACWGNDAKKRSGLGGVGGARKQGQGETCH